MLVPEVMWVCKYTLEECKPIEADGNPPLIRQSQSHRWRISSPNGNNDNFDDDKDDNKDNDDADDKDNDVDR